jgi:hypothetical protein
MVDININIRLLLDDKDIIEDEDDSNLYKEEVILTDHDERINKMLMTFNDYNDIMMELENIHYEDNKYCSMYLGNYIEDYVMTFLGGRNIPIEMEDRRDGVLRRPVDFLLNYNGQELKIKHVASCIEYGSFGYKDAFYWRFNIDFNHMVDAFILSAWDTRKSLVPQYMWLIMGYQKFNGKPFWKRQTLFVEDSKNRVVFMEQFEMKGVRLGKLQDFVAHARKKDMISSLTDVRRKIFLKTDWKIDIKKLARKLLEDKLKKD